MLNPLRLTRVSIFSDHEPDSLLTILNSPLIIAPNIIKLNNGIS